MINYLSNSVIFVLESVFVTKLLILGVLFSTGAKLVVALKLVVLGISF